MALFSFFCAKLPFLSGLVNRVYSRHRSPGEQATAAKANIARAPSFLPRACNRLITKEKNVASKRITLKRGESLQRYVLLHSPKRLYAQFRFAVSL